MGGSKKKTDHNPMGGSENTLTSPCGARTRSGGICGQLAMKNGRCYFHGGKSKAGRAHGRYKHGGCTKEMKALHRELREEAREFVRDFKEISDLLGTLLY